MSERPTLKILLAIFPILLAQLPGCQESTHTFWQNRSLIDTEAFVSLLESDTGLNADLVPGEVIDSVGIRKAIQLDEYSSIWLVPVKQRVLQRYWMVLIQKGSISSFLPIKGAWIDNREEGYNKGFRFLQPPLFEWKDLDGDGEKELIIKDRQHNGTLYNTAVKHLFRVRNESLKYLGAFEYITHLPIEEKFLVRTWAKENGVLKIRVFLKKNLASLEGREVGNYQLHIARDPIFYRELIILDSVFYNAIKSSSLASSCNLQYQQK